MKSSVRAQRAQAEQELRQLIIQLVDKYQLRFVDVSMILNKITSGLNHKAARMAEREIWEPRRPVA